MRRKFIAALVILSLIFLSAPSVNAKNIIKFGKDINIGNDQMSTLVLVSPAPPSDLVMTSVTAPANAVLGQNMSVQWTVQNEGNYQTAIANWYDEVYLSPNPVFNPAQSVALGNFSHFGALDQGASYANNVNVLVPANLVALGGVIGTNYLTVFVENTNSINGNSNSTALNPSGLLVYEVGGAVTIDDVRAALRRLPHVVWLDAPPRVLFARSRSTSRPLARDEAGFAELYEERRPLYGEVSTAAVRTAVSVVDLVW